MGNLPQPWTPERVDHLKHLRLVEGLSFGRIVLELGVTRGAGIGLAARLGLIGCSMPGRSKCIEVARSYKPRIRQRQQVVRMAPTLNWRGVSLYQLSDKTCRWPDGNDPVQLFCGDTSAELSKGHPYCPYHSAKAGSAPWPISVPREAR